MIRTHELKISLEYADSVYFGDKSFEIRFNDRGFQRGDIIRFKPWKNQYVVTGHPLHNKEYEITYVLAGFVGLKEGYVGLGIRPLQKARDK